MREIVFRDPQARSRLEAIIHPLIAHEALARAALAQGCYLVFVVPLLVESKRWLHQVDRVEPGFVPLYHDFKLGGEGFENFNQLGDGHSALASISEA